MTEPSVCVIGNSHIAALRMAIQEFGDLNGTDRFVFFGASGQLARHIVLEDGVVRLAVEGGAEHSERLFGLPYVAIEGFDLFAVGGLGLSLQIAVDLFATHTPWPSAEEDRILVSMDLFRATIADRIQRSRALRLANTLHAEAGKAVAVFVQPATNEAVEDANERDRELWTKTAWHRAVREHRLTALNAIFADELRRASTADIALLPQPIDSLSPSGLTRAEFATPPRPRPAREGFMTIDYGHANPRYGKLVVEQVKEFLGKEPGLREEDGHAVDHGAQSGERA